MYIYFLIILVRIKLEEIFSLGCYTQTKIEHIFETINNIKKYKYGGNINGMSLIIVYDDEQISKINDENKINDEKKMKMKLFHII